MRYSTSLELHTLANVIVLCNVVQSTVICSLSSFLVCGKFGSHLVKYLLFLLSLSFDFYKMTIHECTVL